VWVRVRRRQSNCAAQRFFSPGGIARLLGRPDPGYFDVAKLLPVAYAMAGVILVMSVVLIYADIVVPVRFG